MWSCGALPTVKILMYLQDDHFGESFLLVKLQFQTFSLHFLFLKTPLQRFFRMGFSGPVLSFEKYYARFLCQSICCIFTKKWLVWQKYIEITFNSKGDLLKDNIYVWIPMPLPRCWYWHCGKSVRIRSFSGQYCPVFGLNTEI